MTFSFDMSPHFEGSIFIHAFKLYRKFFVLFRKKQNKGSKKEILITDAMDNTHLAGKRLRTQIMPARPHYLFSHQSVSKREF